MVEGRPQAADDRRVLGHRGRPVRDGLRGGVDHDTGTRLGGVGRCAEAAPHQARGKLGRGPDFAHRGGGEDRAGGDPHEGADRVPDRVQAGCLVGEEFDDVQEARGRQHQGVGEHLELGRQLDVARGPEEPQDEYRRVEIQAARPGGAHRQGNELGGVHGKPSLARGRPSRPVPDPSGSARAQGRSRGLSPGLRYDRVRGAHTLRGRASHLSPVLVTT